MVPAASTAAPASPAASPAAGLRYFAAPRLDGEQPLRWREFAHGVPWASYHQDPAWAEVERCGSGSTARQPFFFWAERDGVICLTALGVRRHLPLPGRVFWEFNRGPLVLDSAVLDDWLSWLGGRLGREAARLRVQPAMRLDAGGDDAETILERQGFARRRAMGGWATLLVDIGHDDDDVLASFRAETRRAIRQSQRHGIEVRVEDTPSGWSTLSSLQAELRRRAPVPELDEATLARIEAAWMAGRIDGSGGTVLVARHDGEPLAAALVIVHGSTAYLPVIPSSHHHDKLPASHLLVYEAMRWARLHGCTTFDLVGYSMMARPGDSLWGINQFKRGFASLDHLTRSLAIHEKVCSPAVCALANAERRVEALVRLRADDRSR